MERVAIDFEKALKNAKNLDSVTKLGKKIEFGLESPKFGTCEQFIIQLEKYRRIYLDFITGECWVAKGNWQMGNEEGDSVSRMPVFSLFTLLGLKLEPLLVTELHPAIRYIERRVDLLFVYIFEANGISVNMINVVLSESTIKEISDSIKKTIDANP